VAELFTGLFQLANPVALLALESFNLPLNSLVYNNFNLGLVILA
jgi:hypothetical protein